MPIAAVPSLGGDARGIWAVLVLLTPVGLLALGPVTESVAPVVGAGSADVRTITATAAAVFVLGGTVLGAALAFRARSGEPDGPRWHSRTTAARPAADGGVPTAASTARRDDSGLRVCQDRRVSVTERPVVVAVCGCPGAGKTTVASATAGRLGIPLLTRDEIKTGLGLSSASVAQDGRLRLGRDFHVAGGPLSRRAEAVMVDAARLFAASGVSFVVESSVLSHELLGVLRGGDARVLAVHVVAAEAVIGRRLGARAADGGAVDQQLLSLFQRGEMRRSIFAPPEGVDAVVEVDTSDHEAPAVDTVVAAVVALLGHPGSAPRVQYARNTGPRNR